MHAKHYINSKRSNNQNLLFIEFLSMFKENVKILIQIEEATCNIIVCKTENWFEPSCLKLFVQDLTFTNSCLFIFYFIYEIVLVYVMFYICMFSFVK